jgi:acyl-coenzyme A thioesterase PaaI-like protein
MSTPDRRARAGRAVRDLGHALIGHEADDDLLDRVACDLESLTEQLGVGAPRSREPASFQQGSHWEAPDEGGPFVTNDDRPVSGRSSPWGLDPIVRRVGDEVEATVTLRSAHEGAPDRSHGGVVAALFDDIFGFVLSIGRTPAFTGELTIRYLRGTPLHVPLRCVARLDSRDGRKLYMTGELTEPDGQVCVRAKATFITIDPNTIPGWGDGV